MNPASPSIEQEQTHSGGNLSKRSKAPVFVLGCDRSGTTFLYHTLLSAGGFAIYHTESNAFNLLGFRFGDLSRRKNRRAMLDQWLHSKLFHRSGLTREEIESSILNDCRNPGDFLRILMDTIARKQGAVRWADCTPPHLLYVPIIKKLIPDALVVHIIRDGRDVTASLNRIGWIRPLPWDKKRPLIPPALYWRWMVGKGRKYGAQLGADYMEIHYEDVVEHPRESLARIGAFIDHDLDYDYIHQHAMGSVVTPNSSFSADKEKEKAASPIGRWKTVLSPQQIIQVECVIGELLQETGYPLATPRAQLQPGLAVSLMSFLYPRYYDLKLWLKSKTPLARMATLDRMVIGNEEERS
ncbi:MAG: sulfotransferase [Terriglobales bacterium]